MCSILDGLVICLWLFFMLHLPLFGCSKIPCTLYWFDSHDVNRHTENWSALFLGASADTERAISCTVMPCLHNVCRVSCQSVIVVNSLIVSGEVATPLQKTFTVWRRLLRVAARIEINCLACMIQTGKFLS